MSQPVKFKAEIMWAFLNKLNPMAEKYTVDLCNLDDNAVKALESQGIKVLSKEGKGRYITCKSVREIVATDASGKQIDALVGNGSKAEALVRPYEWDFKGKKGVSPSLSSLKITDLVVFSPSIDAIEDDVL
jgi:hypothetical protein